MHAYSVKLYANLQRIQKDGSVALYLQVIINLTKKNVPLNLKWPAKYVDNKAGLQPRSGDDQEYHDNLMIINTQISRINDIFKTCRLRDDVPLTMQTFEKEYQTYERKRDFLTFMEKKITERYNDGQISDRTKKNNTATLHKLQLMQTTVMFYELDDRFLESFKTFLLKKGNSHNTVWGNIKDVKTYLHLAHYDRITINMDHEKTKTGSTSGRIVYLDKNELEKMQDLFLSETLDPVSHESLRAFLFQCFTSLRISDVYRANWLWVDGDNNMVFVPKKNERHNIKNKEVTVPLGDVARSLISKSRGLFFLLPAEQTINEKLKIIARDLGIKKKLSTHVGRHTFATNYYRETLDILGLSKIMGHSKLETTKIYSHISDADKRSGIQKFEAGFVKRMNQYNKSLASKGSVKLIAVSGDKR